jgi:hypothetical protein
MMPGRPRPKQASTKLPSLGQNRTPFRASASYSSRFDVRTSDRYQS